MLDQEERTYNKGSKGPLFLVRCTRCRLTTTDHMIEARKWLEKSAEGGIDAARQLLNWIDNQQAISK